MTEKDEKPVNSNEKLSSSVLKVDDVIYNVPELVADLSSIPSSLTGLQATINDACKNLNSAGLSSIPSSLTVLQATVINDACRNLNSARLSSIPSSLTGLQATINDACKNLNSADLSSIPSSLTGLHATINDAYKTLNSAGLSSMSSLTSLQAFTPNPNKTIRNIDPEDIFNISKKHKKIILYDFFDLSQKEVINDFFKSITGKDLVHISDNKSKEVVQLYVNHLPLSIALPKNISSIYVHFGYFFGYHFSLIFECDLSVKDLYESFSENSFESLNERFQLFEDLQVQIEDLLPEQLHGFFFKNELKFEKHKLKLPSIYVYDIHDYKFIFDLQDETPPLMRIERPTLKQKVDSFINIPSNYEGKYGDKVEFNTLSLLGIKPNTLFSLISNKLICSESNAHFEDFLGPIPSNFIILEFEEDELLDFVLQLVSLYYLLIVFEKILIKLSSVKIPEIKVPEIPYLEEEILETKKTEVLKTKIALDEIVRDVFPYLRVFDYFSIDDFKFINEESRSRISFQGKSWDNDSISKYFNDLIIYKKKEIEKRQAHLQERISEINELILNELTLIKNKPKVNSLLNGIEAELIPRIKRWEGKIPQDKIENWLLNFDTKEDRKIALKLLDKLTYVSNQNLTQLINSSNNLLRSKVDFDKQTNCFISSIGNLTSGSTHLAKRFQEGGRIKEKLFKKTEELESLREKNGKIDTLILIDDLIGSGDTYIRWYKKHSDLLNDCSEVIFISLIALQKGINNIKQKTKTLVLSNYILDESDQSIDGTLFDFEEKQEIKGLIEKYSSRISFDYVYGYDNCQLLLAFEDNIPNNSVGVLWWSTCWTPLFERR